MIGAIRRLGVISEVCDEFRIVPGRPFVLSGCVCLYVGYDLLHTMYLFIGLQRQL